MRFMWRSHAVVLSFESWPSSAGWSSVFALGSYEEKQ
jgi:hypothetical protein